MLTNLYKAVWIFLFLGICAYLAASIQGDIMQEGVIIVWALVWSAAYWITFFKMGDKPNGS